MLCGDFFFQKAKQHEIQDIEYEFLDIGNEMMSASIFWGFARYTGTPKTTDTTLALLWNRSSQAEWVIRCEHCGRFNIPNPEQHLLKMIGKHGPVCAHCGKPVFPKNGGYVHARPERQLSFPGYHISQTVHPLHILSQDKWNKLLDKIENYAPLALYNEVFGWPYDAATSPLTMSDLQKATHDISVQRPADVRGLKHLYSYITVAVDWSGGSMVSDSYTAYAVLGLRRDSDVIDVLYGKRIKHGVTPTDEANEIMDWIRGTGADAFTYDNGGAGFARLGGPQLKLFFKCVHQFIGIGMLLFCGAFDILPAFGFIRFFLDHAAFGIPESHLELRRGISFVSVFDRFPGPECQLFFIRLHLIVVFNHFEYGSGNVIFSGAATPFPTFGAVGGHTITGITAGRQKELRFAVSLLSQGGNLFQGLGLVPGNPLSEKTAFSQIELRSL